MVKDPQLFLVQVVGTRSTYLTSDIEDYLRSVIINEFNDMLGETLTSLLDVQAMSLDLAIAAQHALSDDFERLGLELRSFQISAITPPEEVQERIDQRTSMGVLGDMRTYTQFQTAEAIGNMGEGGEGGGGDIDRGRRTWSADSALGWRWAKHCVMRCVVTPIRGSRASKRPHRRLPVEADSARTAVRPSRRARSSVLPAGTTCKQQTPARSARPSTRRARSSARTVGRN